MPKTITIGGTKLTYVSPSIRNTIDSKKLKEEEPELAKKYTKATNVSATVRIETI
jgi:predicted phage-related endonuclease